MNSEQVLRMYDALRRIASGYQTPDQLRRESEKRYGLDFEEALEMAYENIQSEAQIALRGLRRPKTVAAHQNNEGRE